MGLGDIVARLFGKRTAQDRLADDLKGKPAHERVFYAVYNAQKPVPWDYICRVVSKDEQELAKVTLRYLISAGVVTESGRPSVYEFPKKDIKVSTYLNITAYEVGRHLKNKAGKQ